MTDGSRASIVSVVLDVDESSWDQVAAETSNNLTFTGVISCVVTFLNALKAMNRENEVTLLASLPDGTATVWYDRHMGNRIAECVQRGVRAYTASSSTEGYRKLSSLSVSLSRALCRSNRAIEEHKKRIGTEVSARVLVIQARADDATQYIAAMNAAFAAQKRSIVIDVADFTQEGSKILQQVAHLSGGILQQYKNISNQKLMGYMLAVFLSSKEERRLLRLPPEAPIVLQAACFCHGKLQSRGFVCSVCLSVFCENPSTNKDPKKRRATCPTCQTRIHVI